MPDDRARAAAPAFDLRDNSSTNGDAATSFPADRRTIAISAADFAGGGVQTVRVTLHNHHPEVLHVRLAPGADYLTVAPTEAALGADERQAITVGVDVTRARTTVVGGAAPGAAIQLLYQRLTTHESGGHTGPGSQFAPQQGAIHIHLPLATCPSCERSLESLLADGTTTGGLPDVCPYCYERLRPCPVCGAPNAWTARVCRLDPAHVVRTSPDWGMLGGSPAHSGVRLQARPALATLSRRWSYPNVAPARRENALTWSAPAAAYGLVAACAATSDGEAHLYAFDAHSGAPLYDPYPLPHPLYPDRGGVAIAGGRLFAATVEGACVCLDALRGTRIWETALGGKVYGACVPTDDADDAGLLVAVATGDGRGYLAVLDARTGAFCYNVPLTGTPDTAPAFADGTAFVHTDDGALTAIDAQTGAVVWRVTGAAGFDAAPIVIGEGVISASAEGVARRFDRRTGTETWTLAVTRAPFGGTPAGDATLLYLPADDGLHLVGTDSGRAVRRYPLRQPVRAAPVVIGGTVFFGATDGSLYGAMPGQTPERLYETATTGAQIVAAPAFADGALFVAATNGVLYALNAGAQSAMGATGTATAGTPEPMRTGDAAVR